MNVHDEMYAIGPIPAQTFELFAAIAKACEAIGCNRPEKVVTYYVIGSNDEPILTANLVEVSVHPLFACMYRTHILGDRGVLDALEDLARWGCKGNELAFCCRVSDSGFRWVLCDLVTLEPIVVNGAWIESNDYDFEVVQP